MGNKVVHIVGAVLIVAGIAVLISSVYMVTFVRPASTAHNYVQLFAMVSIVAGFVLRASKRRS